MDGLVILLGKITVILIGLLIFFILVFWIFLYSFFWGFISSSGFGNISQLLAAIAAFGAIYYTINEMKKQRDIMGVSLGEMKSQRSVMERTLDEMKKQREESHLPLVVLLQGFADCEIHYSVYNKIFWKTLDTECEPWINEEQKPINLNVKIKLLNLGLGPAHNIIITWDYDYKYMLNELKEKNEIETPNLIYVETYGEERDSQEYLTTNHPNDHDRYVIYPIQKTDYILPSLDNKNQIFVNLPESYLLLASYYLPYLDNTEYGPLSDSYLDDPHFDYTMEFYNHIRSLKMNIGYYDRENVFHQEQFEVNIINLGQNTVSTTGDTICRFHYKIIFEKNNAE